MPNKEITRGGGPSANQRFRRVFTNKANYCRFDGRLRAILWRTTLNEPTEAAEVMEPTTSKEHAQRRRNSSAQDSSLFDDSDEDADGFSPAASSATTRISSSSLAEMIAEQQKNLVMLTTRAEQQRQLALRSSGSGPNDFDGGVRSSPFADADISNGGADVRSGSSSSSSSSSSSNSSSGSSNGRGAATRNVSSAADEQRISWNELQRISMDPDADPLSRLAQTRLSEATMTTTTAAAAAAAGRASSAVRRPVLPR